MAQFENMNEREQMQMLMSQLQDSSLRQSVMQYINQTASGLDKDANSKALIETLARESVCNQKNTAMWKSRTKKSLALGVVGVVLAITMQFAVNFFTNELSKESHVDPSGALVNTNGQTVQTRMEEMKVGTDGRLVSRDGKSSVKTMPTLARVALVSSLPDSTLMGMDEIVVHSDKGHTLQIKVQGFSRIPVLNSRCGNVVHFYTAWKGKITLDSNDISLDDATAAEFENAGITLAMSGRRLAEGSTVDGFFKDLEAVKASGKWTCAGVPLPSVPRTYVFSTTEYSPCKQRECESRFGSYVPGAERATRDFVLAISAPNARISGGLVPGMYFKTQETQMVSDRYQANTETRMLHPGQRFVRIFDTHTKMSQEFQLSANGTKSRCVSQLEIKKETKADSDMHFEYVGMEEETGSMLRHFRMTKSHEFLVEVAGDDVKSGVTEFWDDAQTLQPRRIVDSDGTVTMFESIKASLSDADIEKQFGVWLDDCTEQDKEEMGIPLMSKLADLNEQEIEYYKAQEFRQSEELWKSAAANNDAFAIYLMKANDPSSVSDRCKAKCQTVIDAAMTRMQVQSLTCEEGSILKTAMKCMQEVRECVDSNFYVDRQYDCFDSENETEERQLETEEEETETEQEGGFQLLLSNHTEATGAVSRQMFDWGPDCLSFYFMPISMGAKRLDWNILTPDITLNKENKTLWKKERVTWTWPWCMQLQLDKNYKPIGALGKKWAAKKIGKKMLVTNEEGADSYFTIRLSWFRVKDPYDSTVTFNPRKMTLNRGKLALELMIRACVPLQYMMGFAVPALPIYCKMCGSVMVGLTKMNPCPVVPGEPRTQESWSVSGRGTVSLSVGLDLLVKTIECGKLELSIWAGTEYKKNPMTVCYWIKALEDDGGRGRRRQWDRRRRSKRECYDLFSQTCDTVIKGALLVKALIWQATLSLSWYSKKKFLEFRFKCEIFRFWRLTPHWHAYYDDMLWSKPM